MTQTTEQRRQAARALAYKMFTEANKTANLNLNDFQAAVGAIDDKMDALANTLTPNQSVKTNLVQALPEPFKSNSTPAEKAFVLVYWALQEVGLNP